MIQPLSDKLKVSIILFLSITFFSNNGIAQMQEQMFANEYTNNKCTYETNQGRINGKYVSYYKNGIKKAEGEFLNNYRIGKWTIYDSTGKIVVQRLYSDPFTFKSIVPENSSNVPKYTIKYNKEGYIDYFHIEEKMVHVSKRIWRNISETNNPILFDNNKLFRFLQKNIWKKNITAFTTDNDEFLKTKEVESIDTINKKIVGFKIKEDFFIDNERLVSEIRILGICPVALDTTTNFTKELYWVYFPEVRKYLAQEKVSNSSTPSNIKTLDDLFFFRNYSSIIYKESNVYDRKISDYKFGEDIQKEAERIEIDIIELENNSLIYLTKK